MKAQDILLKQLWENGYARDPQARVVPSTVHEFAPLNNPVSKQTILLPLFYKGN